MYLPQTSTTGSDELDSNIFHSASADGHLLDLSPRSTTAVAGSSLIRDGGLVLTDITNLHLFSVTGYKGDPTLDYLCAQVHVCNSLHLPPAPQ